MRQPNWDKYETALLIEAYLKIKSDRSQKKAIVASLSSFLRKRVSFEIDDTFRNENGINMRLAELDYIFFNGSVGLKNTATVFREMVALYLNDKCKFEAVLEEAKTKTSGLKKDLITLPISDDVGFNSILTSAKARPNQEKSFINEKAGFHREKDVSQTESNHGKSSSDDTTIASIMGVQPESFANDTIEKLRLETRSFNCLRRSGVRTIKELFELSLENVKNTRFLGSKSYVDIIQKLKKYIDKNNDLGAGSTIGLDAEIKPSEAAPTTIESILHDSKDEIAVGDFSFMNNGHYSDSELAAFEKYKAAYDVLGEDLVFDCICSPGHIVPIIIAFANFNKRTENTKKLERIIKSIPANRQHSCCKFFIDMYSSDDAIRKRISSYYASGNAELSSIIDTIDAENQSNLVVAERFLKWCTYDLRAQIDELFGKLYNNNRTRQIIEARSQKRTLNDIGDQLNITRERARQIEARAIRSFSRQQSRICIIRKLYAEQNGQDVITLEALEKVSGNNAPALIYLLRQTESHFYTYNTMLSAFVVGHSDLETKVRDFVDSLPDVIRGKDMPGILETAKQEEDLYANYIEKAIHKSFELTGNVYHKTHLSLSRIYEEILRTYYPKGIHVYDDSEIVRFRSHIIEEYGNISLPENNRAITARIISIGTLAGRGIYVAKRKKWVSKKLEKKIIDFIESNDSPVLLIGMVFAEFEDELLKEGIDNRYFLQGVLRELFGDRLYFRRDYVSRDKNFTSIYSSIISFIKQHPYPVEKEEIRERFKGITEIVITSATNDSEILNFLGKYLHGSRLIIHDVERLYLRNYLDKCLRDNEAHHIKDIYSALTEAKPEVFSRNAAAAPYCAFSVLEYLFRDQFQFSRPYIAKNDVEIGRPIERLKELIYSEDEFLLTDINIFARDNHVQLYSILDFINSLNDKFLMKNKDAVISIEKAGISESVAKQVENIIREEISETMPIRNLLCVSKLPVINCAWSEWLVYSVLFKWSKVLDVDLSSSQLRQSIPLVAPKGAMNTAAFKDISAASVKAEIDNLDNIDDLIADLITEDMLEDV